jgi:hypothetical protein
MGSWIAALTAFKARSCAYLYQRQKPPDSVEAWGEKPLCGWKTTPGNRDDMIDTWIAHCRPDPIAGFEDRIVVHSQRLADEEDTFVVTKSGKREHRRGCHDDLLFAAMIALQLHLRCPRGIGSAPASESEEVAAMREAIEREGLVALNRPAARDPGIIDDDDDDDDDYD